MGNIRVLPDAVASQVAAGEVVERPSSIVKELLENSLDAGASRIRVEFSGGGMRRILVMDDGGGMDREDALLCLERHATSKIRSFEDLAAVRTMGFRGEALPSIASVARFRLLTCARGAPEGTEVRVEGGKLLDVRSAACAPGTLVEVRDVFFNVPARRKFVRGEETESAHIVAVVQSFALGAANVALECWRDGRAVIELPAAREPAERVCGLFGRAFAERLIPVGPFERDGARIWGFMGREGEGRRDRQQQFVVLNGRPVVSAEVSGALREACGGLLPPGRHPTCVLWIEMDPVLADCNAHPAKRVVRFARPEQVRRLVYEAAEAALRRAAPAAPTQQPPAAPAAPLRAPENELSVGRTVPGTAVPSAKPVAAAPLASPPEAHAPEAHGAPAALPPEAPPFQPIGRLGLFYHLFEGPEGLVVMDMRSAWERIEFERLMRQMPLGSAPSQRLLIPEVAELPPREHAWVAENLGALAEAGFQIEAFGGLSVKIEAVPAPAARQNPSQVLHDVAAAMRAAGRMPKGGGLREELARTLCRMAPAPAGAPADLLAELLRCELPYANPFGQPTLIQFSHAELARKFGRGG
ncbi:MAG: DNA mismatch repair endonuclease MutL [Terrimicrobiaceae bacterium]|nr:DNA mismatch repair endonuclease MutL [Terrimicrobiaceae bacterium]